MLNRLNHMTSYFCSLYISAPLRIIFFFPDRNEQISYILNSSLSIRNTQKYFFLELNKTGCTLALAYRIALLHS
jgi:hypothetical protein